MAKTHLKIVSLHIHSRPIKVLNNKKLESTINFQDMNGIYQTPTIVIITMAATGTTFWSSYRTVFNVIDVSFVGDTMQAIVGVATRQTIADLEKGIKKSS